MAQRKSPEDRREEIRAAAAQVALQEGLGRITSRRIASVVGVKSGLITHYFPSIDQLVAEAFAEVVEQERVKLVAATSPLPDSIEKIRQTLAAYVSVDRDPLSLLWLDAWREAADRPMIREVVVEQMEHDVAAMEALIQEGVSAGDLHIDSPVRAAMRILSILDGHVVSSAVRTALTGSSLDYPAVEDMLFSTAERELGLPAGALHPA